MRLLAAALLAGTIMSACAGMDDYEPYPPPPPPLPPPPPPPLPPPPPPPPPVQATRIVSSSATAAYWTYESSLQGLSHAQRVAHVRQWQPYPEQLPAAVNASYGDRLWIVPVCGGSPRWQLARIYSVNTNFTVTISC